MMMCMHQCKTSNTMIQKQQVSNYHSNQSPNLQKSKQDLTGGLLCHINVQLSSLDVLITTTNFNKRINPVSKTVRGKPLT